MSRIKQFCMESYVDNILLYHSHGIFTHRVLINERRGLLQTSVSKWIIGDRGISVKLVTSADRKTTVVMTPAELLKNRRKYYIPKKSKKHDEFQTLGIRMTKTEIRKISELARVKGYKTRSEFIRSFINSELALAGL